MYILSSGFGQLDVYTCDLSFKSCSVQSPLLSASNDCYGVYSSKLYVTCSDPDQKFVNVVTCDGISCINNKLTPIVGDKPGNLYYPVIAAVKSKIHIAVYALLSGSILLYTCNKDITQCSKYGYFTGTTYLGLTSEFNTAVYNDNIYIAYHNNYGPNTDLSIAMCETDQDGSIVNCLKRVDGIQRGSIGFNRPHIAFAPYLGAVVAVSNIISSSTENIAISRANIDLSNDDRSAFYAYGFGGDKGMTNTNSGEIRIFDINPETARMKITIQKAYTELNIYTDLFIFDAYLFPSTRGASTWYLSNAGYNNIFPHDSCEGKIADEVVTCTSTLKDGECTQQIIFTGGDFTTSKTYQKCTPKIGRGVQKLYPRGTNPHSTNACVSDSNLFDSGPNVPLLATVVADIILYYTTTFSTKVYWRGGVVNDLCYHNTASFTGYDKNQCDELALKIWVDDCGEIGEIVDSARRYITNLIYPDPVEGESVDMAEQAAGVTCTGIATMYYMFLKTNYATTAYFATNSNIKVPPIDDIDNSNNSINNDDSILKQAANAVLDELAATQGTNVQFNTTEFNVTRLAMRFGEINRANPPMPTAKPTTKPTHKPTHKPTRKPTKKPTKKHKQKPTHKPTKKHSKKPKRKPTKKPKRKPTKKHKPGGRRLSDVTVMYEAQPSGFGQ